MYLYQKLTVIFSLERLGQPELYETLPGWESLKLLQSYLGNMLYLLIT